MDICKAILNWLKFRMWRASWIILIVFLALFIVDLYSTLRVGDIAILLESNPLGIPYTMLLNFIAIYILLRGYDKFSAIRRFNICNYFIWVCVIRINTIWSNFQVGKRVDAGEITYEIAAAVTDTVKQNYYFTNVVLPLLLVTLSTWATFRLYCLDHNCSRKE